ncbi:MAG: GNAT family N-acetyltransferase [Oscillospiraceae bacterium]|nr:GNAT family N-acetyltransferase [Oscillospiraceae bacterium]
MYRIATEKDIPGIIDLWQEAFHETPVLPDCISFVGEADGEVVCMLHALPQTLRASRDRKAYYLYAIATKKEYRGRGLCRGLMAYAEQTLDADCCVLVPASGSLFGFYRELGYETAFTRRRTAFTGGEEIPEAEYLTLREQLLPMAHMVYDDLSYAQKIYGLKFYKTEAGICAASDSFTAERIPEDFSQAPYGMLKWLRDPEPVENAFLGFSLE